MPKIPESAKQAVTRAGHGRSFKRRLPPELGGLKFPASLEGGSKFLRRDLLQADPVLTNFAMEYVSPGSCVWDVGANVGLFTFSAAGLAGTTGRVVAVEADTWLASNLRSCAMHNAGRGAPITVLPVAISDDYGLAEFNIANGARATNFLSLGGGSTTTGGVRETQTVPTLPLDELLRHYPEPDVLKIDVEGAEELVLSGAEKTLSARPVLLLEVFSAQAARVHELLQPFGYRYRNAATGESCDLPSFNVIATAANSA